MKFDVITLFPEMFDALTASKIFSDARKKKTIQLNLHNLRDFSQDKHRVVDDTPYGGGPGMILKPEPLVGAIEHIAAKPAPNICRIYLSPKGKRFDFSVAEDLLQHDQLIFVCGRYQGIDQRVIDGWIDLELSAGDFILSGGEMAALLIIDALARLVPGVLGNAESKARETFGETKLEYPQYTKPRDFRGRQVPEVLLNGNHGEIETWRRTMIERALEKAKDQQ